MKKISITLSIALLFVSGLTFAQELEVPKTGAKIYLSNSSFELGTNDELNFDLKIVRSKKATKSKFDAPKFLGSSELEIVLTPDPSDADNFNVSVKSQDVKPGNYFYTVSSRSRSTQKVKGTTITILVKETGKVVVSGNE